MIVPSVSRSDGLERRVVVGDLVAGVLAQALAAVDVGVDRAADDRAGAHDRHLDGEVVERLGPRAAQRGHLRAALDLEDARRLGLLDRGVGLAVVVGDPREVDPLAARARDRLHAALDRREHPQAEQVDLQEARVRAGVLVPLAHLAALHRGGHAPGSSRPAGGSRRSSRPSAGRDGAAGRRPRRTAAPARPSGRPGRARASPSATSMSPSTPRARRTVGAARDALDLPRRQAERLAELADRPARAEGREGGHQRRALAPVALVHARDQHLADVAREVEVDVGQRGELLVEEAPEQQLVARSGRRARGR